MLSFNRTVLFLKIIIAALFTLFLLYRQYISHPKRKTAFRRQRSMRYLFLILLALCAVFAFFNLGQLRGQGFIHYGEMYHYYFGTKYYKELGYFNLYNATVVADSEQENSLAAVDVFQNLEDYTFQSRQDVLARSAEYKAGFSEKRWQNFSSDLNFFIGRCNAIADDYFPRLLLDHGYNGTPVFTLLAGLLTNLIPVTHLNLLALLDVLLLSLMFLVLGRTFDFELAMAAVIFFAVNILNDYGYVMGSILRYDWLICLIMAFCWLSRRKYLPAGIILAYAVLVRIFPVVFLCGPGIVAVWSIIHKKKIPGKYLKWAGGFSGATILLLGLSLLHPQPVQKWQTFFKNMQLHNAKVSINFVGLKSLLLADSSYFDKAKFENTYRDREQGMIPNWQAVKQQTFSQRRILFYGLFLLSLTGLIILVRKRNMDDPEALGWGVLLCFSGFMMSHYYYMFLILWFITLYRRPVTRGNTLQLLAITVIQILFCLLDLKYGSHIVFFTLCSLIFASYFLYTWVVEFLTPVPVPVEHKKRSPGKRKKQYR